jgi:hypothetical protein
VGDQEVVGLQNNMFSIPFGVFLQASYGTSYLFGVPWAFYFFGSALLRCEALYPATSSAICWDLNLGFRAQGLKLCQHLPYLPISSVLRHGSWDLCNSWVILQTCWEAQPPADPGGKASHDAA